MNDYDKHYEREIAVNYIEKMAMEYLQKPIDRKKYLGMSEEDLENRYIKLVQTTVDKVKEELKGVKISKTNGMTSLKEIMLPMKIKAMEDVLSNPAYR